MYTFPPDPANTTVTKLEFRNRFTDNEKTAIYTEAEQNIQVRIWIDDLNAATEVDLTNPRTVEGVQGLVSLNVITAERAAEILST